MRHLCIYYALFFRLSNFFLGRLFHPAGKRQASLHGCSQRTVIAAHRQGDVHGRVSALAVRVPRFHEQKQLVKPITNFVYNEQIQRGG